MYFVRLLLDSRVVDVPMASNATFVILSSLKPLLFKSLNNIAAKLIYYVFDIVCHIARRYKAISSHSKEDMVWRPQLPRNNASSC